MSSSLATQGVLLSYSFDGNTRQLHDQTHLLTQGEIVNIIIKIPNWSATEILVMVQFDISLMQTIVWHTDRQHNSLVTFMTESVCFLSFISMTEPCCLLHDNTHQSWSPGVFTVPVTISWCVSWHLHCTRPTPSWSPAGHCCPLNTITIMETMTFILPAASCLLQHIYPHIPVLVSSPIVS